MADDIHVELREDRPFAQLSETGMLWLINRVAFHPRGFALGINYDGEGNVTGWSMLGDGEEVWSFSDDMDDAFFPKAEAFLNSLRKTDQTKDSNDES